MEKYIKCSPECTNLCWMLYIAMLDAIVNTRWSCCLEIAPPRSKANCQHTDICWVWTQRGVMNRLISYWECKWKKVKRARHLFFSMPLSLSTPSRHLLAQKRNSIYDPRGWWGTMKRDKWRWDRDSWCKQRQIKSKNAPGTLIFGWMLCSSGCGLMVDTLQRCHLAVGQSACGWRLIDRGCF